MSAVDYDASGLSWVWFGIGWARDFKSDEVDANEAFRLLGGRDDGDSGSGGYKGWGTNGRKRVEVNDDAGA
jgi:hypothetical protein